MESPKEITVTLDIAAVRFAKQIVPLVPSGDSTTASKTSGG